MKEGGKEGGREGEAARQRKKDRQTDRQTRDRRRESEREKECWRFSERGRGRRATFTAAFTLSMVGLICRIFLTLRSVSVRVGCQDQR